MKCPICGQVNREEARFCKQCGAELPPSPPPEPLPATDSAAEAPPLAEGQDPPAGEPGSEAPAETEEPEEEEDEAPAALEAEADQPPPVLSADGGEQPAAETEEPEEEEGEEEDVLTLWREQAEPLEPVAPGTVLNGRYVVREVLAIDDEGTTYLAGDLCKCWQCGFEGNFPDDLFCSSCGAELSRKPACQLLERLIAGGEEISPDSDQIQFVENGRLYIVLPEVETVAAPSAAPPANIRLVVGQRSDTGRVRELDEDSLLALTLSCTYESEARPVLGLFVVADGMGGHEGGEIASKLALQMLANRVLQSIFLPEMAGERCLGETISTCLREGVQAANEAVYSSRQKRGTNMGTTLTAGLFKNGQLYLAHVGDCRAYRWGEEGLQQLTEDHSLIARLIASGNASPEEIYTHPKRSVIYRSIGDKPEVEIDTILTTLAPGERLILCCDGLWEMIRDEGIEEVMLGEADPQAACDIMIRQANLSGGEDNISVIVVQVETA
jgi:serine/threonine protein phosphatase PrpC